MQDYSFSLKEEFQIWKTKFFAKQIYFQKYNGFINQLFCKLYLPLHNYLISLKKKNELKYYLSKKFFLINFLTYLEIFLNEERKLLVSYNNIPPSEISRLKKTQNTIINSVRKRGNANLKSHEEKVHREKLNFMNEFIKNKIPIPQLVLNQRNVCSQFRRNPILPCIESHFIFSFLWSNCSLVNENARVFLIEFLSQLLNDYIEDSSIDKNIFANGLLYLLETQKKYSFMDFFYDMFNCRWLLWKETKLPDYPIISNNYNSDLDYGEMVRLNPLVADLQVLKKFMGEKEIQMTALPNLEEQQFITNDITKKCQYFLDFLLGYNQPFFVTSSSQAGKTTLIKYKIKKMLEQNIGKVISLSLTGNTKAETVYLN